MHHYFLFCRTVASNVTRSNPIAVYKSWPCPVTYTVARMEKPAADDPPQEESAGKSPLAYSTSPVLRDDAVPRTPGCYSEDEEEELECPADTIPKSPGCPEVQDDNAVPKTPGCYTEEEVECPEEEEPPSKKRKVLSQVQATPTTKRKGKRTHKKHVIFFP